MKGYIGKILYFNLSQSKKEIRDLDTDNANYLSSAHVLE